MHTRKTRDHFRILVNGDLYNSKWLLLPMFMFTTFIDHGPGNDGWCTCDWFE